MQETLKTSQLVFYVNGSYFFKSCVLPKLLMALLNSKTSVQPDNEALSCISSRILFPAT